MEKIPVSFKIDPKLAAKLRAASKGLYAPSMTAIVERGIELALREIDKKK